MKLHKFTLPYDARLRYVKEMTGRHEEHPVINDAVTLYTDILEREARGGNLCLCPADDLVRPAFYMAQMLVDCGEDAIRKEPVSESLPFELEDDDGMLARLQDMTARPVPQAVSDALSAYYFLVKKSTLGARLIYMPFKGPAEDITPPQLVTTRTIALAEKLAATYTRAKIFGPS